MSITSDIQELIEKYKEGNFDQYEYMSKIHEYNKILFSFKNRIENSDIEKIEIRSDGIIFTISPLHIKLMIDGSCRSAPFEILNFSKYEPGEAEMVFRLLNKESIVFDIGAHIGWYSLNFSKRCSKVYSFEPIKNTFEYLEKNVQLNHQKNIEIFNFGVSEQAGECPFYYFQGGSAIASIHNLIDHPSAKQVVCKLKTLDDITTELKNKRLDFLKCDVEGSELSVFKGGMISINKFKPIIYCELYEPWCQKFNYHADEVLRLLQTCGYDCYAVHSNGALIHQNIIDNSQGKYNFFFLHSDKHREIINVNSEYL